MKYQNLRLFVHSKIFICPVMQQNRHLIKSLKYYNTCILDKSYKIYKLFRIADTIISS